MSLAEDFRYTKFFEILKSAKITVKKAHSTYGESLQTVILVLPIVLYFPSMGTEKLDEPDTLTLLKTIELWKI